MKLGGPLRLSMASAMMERAEFPVHKKRTLYFFSMENPLSNAGEGRALTAPQGGNNQVHSMTFLYAPFPGGCLREPRTLPTRARRDRGPTPYPAARSSIPFSSRRGRAIRCPATADGRPAQRRSTPLEFLSATNRRVLPWLL